MHHHSSPSSPTTTKTTIVSSPTSNFNHHNHNESGEVLSSSSCVQCSWSSTIKSTTTSTLTTNGDDGAIVSGSHHPQLKSLTDSHLHHSYSKSRTIRIRRADPNAPLGFSIRGGKIPYRFSLIFTFFFSLIFFRNIIFSHESTLYFYFYILVPTDHKF